MREGSWCPQDLLSNRRQPRAVRKSRLAAGVRTAGECDGRATLQPFRVTHEASSPRSKFAPTFCSARVFHSAITAAGTLEIFRILITLPVPRTSDAERGGTHGG